MRSYMSMQMSYLMYHLEGQWKYKDNKVEILTIMIQNIIWLSRLANHRGQLAACLPSKYICNDTFQYLCKDSCA